MQPNNSVSQGAQLDDQDLDRKDPDRMYRYMDLGISTRPDENCGNAGEDELR